MDTNTFILASKRGWGLIIMGLGFGLPVLATYLGVTYDANAVNTFAADGVNLIGQGFKFVGSALALWGMFRPTGKLVILPK